MIRLRLLLLFFQTVLHILCITRFSRDLRAKRVLRRARGLRHGRIARRRCGDFNARGRADVRRASSRLATCSHVRNNRTSALGPARTPVSVSGAEGGSAINVRRFAAMSVYPPQWHDQRVFRVPCKASPIANLRYAAQ